MKKGCLLYLIIIGKIYVKECLGGYLLFLAFPPVSNVRSEKKVFHGKNGARGVFSEKLIYYAFFSLKITSTWVVCGVGHTEEEKF